MATVKRSGYGVDCHLFLVQSLVRLFVGGLALTVFVYRLTGLGGGLL